MLFGFVLFLIVNGPSEEFIQNADQDFNMALGWVLYSSLFSVV